MKINAVTYHYIRDNDKDYPNYDSLKKKLFQKQISFFKNKNVVTSLEECKENSENYILTFDDGLIDHLWVANELYKNKMKGIFFISTSPLENKIVLDVHKVHLLLGKIDPQEVYQEFENYIKKKNIKNFLDKEEEFFFKDAYSKYNDLIIKKKFKKIMNYYADMNARSKILNYLLDKFDIKVTANQYYLNENQIRELNDLGMVIGAHGYSHNVLSRMNFIDQKKDIELSKKQIEKIIGKNCEYFCFPYGSKLSYNEDTINILSKLNFKYAFTVEHRNIEIKDIEKNPFELPRYDCNHFL